MLKKILNLLVMIFFSVIILTGCSKNEISKIKVSDNDIIINIKIPNNGNVHNIRLYEIINKQGDSKSYTLDPIFEKHSVDLIALNKDEYQVKIIFSELEAITPNLTIKLFHDKKYRLVTSSSSSTVTLTDFILLSNDREESNIKIIKNDSFINMK